MSHSSLIVAKYLLINKKDEKSIPAFSPMKIIKLVYIAHGWTLGINGVPLIKEPVEAWRYGPVIRELYTSVKQFRNNPIELNSLPDIDQVEFNDDEKDVMDEVLSEYGGITAMQLSAITHADGTPWDITQKNGRIVITNDLIREHYRKLYIESNF